MPRQMLEIRYRCLHPSCCVNCREGLVAVDEAQFQELDAKYPEPDVFKSPKGACRIGFSQRFKAISVEKTVYKEDEELIKILVAKPECCSKDPIAILMSEHKKIRKTLELIEDQVKRRDVDALWASTVELGNELTLHSVKKEEEVLFPSITGLVPLGETLVSIIKEEHSEVVSLLHNFRETLRDGVIMDGIIDSMMVSLRGHIRKEDMEFFEILNKCLDGVIKGKLVDDMERIEKSFVPMEVIPRTEKTEEERALRQQFDEDLAAVRDIANIGGGCCD